VQVSVKVEGLAAVQASIAGRVKQVRFATAKALTDTASAIKAAIPGALARDLDRPTEFTKRGVYLKAARREDLRAEVGFQQIQARYLQYQVFGGLRSPARKALRLPSNIPLDASGNLPPRTIAKLIQAAQAGKFGKGVQRRLGINAAGKPSDRRKRNAAAGPSLFYGQPKGKRKLPPGIYRRVPGRPGKLIPIIVFPARPAKYKTRFDFYGLADRTVRTEWPRKLEEALQFALATAR
jgi:hypothetical protein